MVAADSNYLLMFNLSCSSLVNTKYLTSNYDLKIGIWGDSEVHDYSIEILHFFKKVAIMAWYQIPSEVNIKMMFSAFLQSPRPSVNAMFIFRTIYTGIFSLLFHNNNYN